MNKKLMICQTSYQIIIALILQKQIVDYDSNDFDLIITDTFGGYEKIVERLKKEQCFHHIYIANVKQMLYPDSILKKVKKVKDLVFFHSGTVKVLNEKMPEYAQIYFWNRDLFTINICTILKKAVPKLEIYIFEEGFISYLSRNKVLVTGIYNRLAAIRNRLLRIPVISNDQISGFFVFEPTFFKSTSSFPVYQINRTYIRTDEFKNLVDSIFQAKAYLKYYTTKYILFEDGNLLGHRHFNDMELYQTFIKYVGSDNVTVKCHPRSNKSKFDSLGVRVVESEGVPWEAIMLSGKIDDRVLVSVGSGSITNARLLFGDDIEAILLYKCMKKKLPQFGDEFDDFCQELNKESNEKQIYIPNSMEELRNVMGGLCK